MSALVLAPMKTTSRLSPFAGRGQRLLALLLITALLGLAPAAFADATLTEMLELGIYSEETKGDLPAAIKLYEQIVSEADAGQALAAQAQFRLATCYHKQGDYAAATAAFEKLARDFPGQKELVALAKEYLADGGALLPAPWADHEELRYDVRLGTGLKMGFGRFAIHSGMNGDRKVWHLQNQIIGGAQSWSHVEVDAATFKPIHSVWKISVIGIADTTYTADGADVRMNGQDAAKHVDLTGPAYDNEEAIQLIRRLPLAPGYTTTLTILASISGGNIIPVPLSVGEVETITVPAGTFDCYPVTLKVGPNDQNFWYSTDEHRYLVKLTANGANIELTGITTNDGTEPATYRDPVFGFSVTVPAGWFANRTEGSDETQRSTVRLLDANGTGVTQVKVQSQSRFTAEDLTSLQTFADHQIEQARKHVNNLKLHSDSPQELTVAGQPAIGIVADFTDPPSPKPQTMHVVWALLDGNVVEIWSATAAEDFDAFQSQFDAVVASFRSK